jgi:two-component system chemotaxis response regulator CheY
MTSEPCGVREEQNMAMQLRFLESGAASSAVRESPLKGKTILVVDDSRAQRRKLRELYESLGMRCVGEASNGLEGLTLAEQLRPDVVSLDILMPVMHGVEALGYIRQSGCSRFVVLVSAIPSLEEVARLRPMGHMPDAIFSKRDSRESFREVLSNILLADASQREAASRNADTPEHEPESAESGPQSDSEAS